MKRKPFRVSEGIVRVVSWHFENGVIMATQIKFIEAGSLVTEN